MRNVINAQKDDVFRIRMNSEIKSELEEVFAKNGLTLTDAVNVFFQQALNTLPEVLHILFQDRCFPEVL